ncbi:hypothetical protein H072_197 [Dactylellina haptotyla CBS 200.50]|uniref:BTB domain-containing protein n=1 Tax=Dactylellina haptotyla (strain CBS 200.50) TaxID=1284197 RepID=S8AY30_DACHA|nr:hypothetical protein H072_197 [Dactylellina haptotyla CBS 200.50]
MLITTSNHNGKWLGNDSNDGNDGDGDSDNGGYNGGGCNGGGCNGGGCNGGGCNGGGCNGGCNGGGCSDDNDDDNLSVMEAVIEAPLYTSEYADLTLLVGEDATEFQVHRGIVTLYSKFFKVVCQNPNFREGQERVIRLPELDAETVKRLLQWFYQAPLEIPSDIISDDGYEVTINLLNAADFLEIDDVIKMITDATEDYFTKCDSWSPDREEARADEQKKVDLLCRVYELGGKIDANCFKRYLGALKKSHNTGLFMNMVKELEDCHHALFQDIMVALYANVG